MTLDRALDILPSQMRMCVLLTCKSYPSCYRHSGLYDVVDATQVYKLAETINSSSCSKITREPGPVKGGSTVIAFAQDPDGYMFELIQRGPTPEPLCQVMLRDGDLDRSIMFYGKVLFCKRRGCLKC